MSQENVDKARDFIAAYNRRDFDAAVGSDTEIEWVLPPRHSSDSCRGPDAVKRFWEGLDETFEELRLEPQEFIDAGDHVATRLRYYGRGKSGAEIEGELYHQVATFRAGRMVRIEYFGEWSEALDAAGSRTAGRGAWAVALFEGPPSSGSSSVRRQLDLFGTVQESRCKIPSGSEKCGRSIRADRENAAP